MNSLLHLLLYSAFQALLSIVGLFAILVLVATKRGPIVSTKPEKEASVKRQLLEGLLIFYAFISLAAGAVEVFTSQHEFDNRDRFWFIAGMLSWAFVYNYLRKGVVFKVLFGFAQVIGGLWANWYQLGVMNRSNLIHGKVDRLLFLCAGIALLAKGIKDIDESLFRKRNKYEKLTPQASESSATQIPGH